MLRKSRVFDCLKELCESITRKQIEDGFQGITAFDMTALLQMNRSNISKELNALFQEKRLLKVSGRPVYYFDVEKMKELTHQPMGQFEADSLTDFLKLTAHKKHDDFEGIIGSGGSLKTVIKKAKAAMIYPPFGLHTLLVGPTGSGKTMFAEIMFRYAKEQGVLTEDSQFIVFNCAEYADNPQLLLAQLFGYEKGAFTGADRAMDGLVDKAKNGVLFLDEIHRLPPEGQEMLFMLFDRGEYRKLGANQTIKDTKVLIIAATTEDLESSLLQTFLRRMPMTIAMPSLDKRSIDERFALIEKFFSQEYNQVQIPIQVNSKVIRALLSYDCIGNVGQLMADIRLLCANGFLEYKSTNGHFIHITISLLQEYIYHGLLLAGKQKEVNDFLSLQNQELFLYDKRMLDTEKTGLSMFNIYTEMNRKYEGFEKKGYDHSEVNHHMKNYIEDYIKSLSNQFYKNNEEEKLDKIIPIQVYHIVEIAMQLAEQRLNYKISKKVIIAMALHVSSILENKRTYYDLNKKVYDVLLENPNEYQIAKEMMEFLEKELDVTFKKQELVFFTMFLCIEKDNIDNQRSIALLVLAHGNGVARNTVDVANSLLQTTHGHALDMSLHQNVDDFLEVVIKKVIEIEEGKGVLIFVDMGSLLSFGDIITKRTNIPVKTIDMISTPFVLEALRKTMLSEYTLDDLYKELRSYTPYIGKLYSKEIKQKTAGKYAIITTCLTGEGAAVKLGELICSAIPFVKEYHVEIIPCNKETFKQKNISDKRILAVVGALDLRLEDTLYISSDKIILEDGLLKINQIIEAAVGAVSEEVVSSNIVMNNFLKETLVFLDPVKADDVIRSSFQILHKMIDIPDYNRILIGYMLHVGCMIERCIRGDTMDYEGYEERIKNNKKLYHIIKTAIKIMEDEFQIRINDTEVVYLMDIFDTD